MLYLTELSIFLPFPLAIPFAGGDDMMSTITAAPAAAS